MKRMLLSAAAITTLLVTGGAVAQTSGEAEGELLPQQGQTSSGGAVEGGATGQQGEVPQAGAATQAPNEETGDAAGTGAQPDAAAQTSGEAAQPSGETAGGEAAGQAGGAAATGEAQTGSGDDQAGTAAGTEKAQPEAGDGEQAQSGEAGQKAAGAQNVEVNQEQRTVIRQTIVEQGVKPVADVDFDINIGVTVPQTVEFYPLPPRIVEIVPAYAGYKFLMLADGTIVIVDPGSLRIVYVIPA